MLTDQQVTQFFRAIARREPVKAEVDRYADLGTEAEAIAAITLDEGAETGRVTTFYQIFYNRLPDAGGLDFWTGVLTQNPGYDNARLANAFFGAGEFEALYGGRPVEEAVRAIYENVLGREADEAGLTFWTDAVTNPDNGFGLRELGLAFAQSSETAATFAPLIEDYLAAMARDASIPVALFDYADGGGGEKPDTGTEFEGGEDKVGTSAAELISKGAVEPRIGTQNAESADLMNLTALRADARFADADGAGLTVAVIDTGIDLDHPAFGPLRGGVSDRILRAIDFTGEGDGTPDDVDGHGSNVASIIASENPAYLGVAPGADIVALQALANDGFGTDGSIEQALAWVVRNAAALDIVTVNMSLGGFSNTNFESAAFGGLADELAALNRLGVTVIASAGNSYFDFQTPGSSDLSADPNTISVGALWDESRTDVFWGSGAKDFVTVPGQITSFSQRATGDIDTIFAPGALIVGAAPGGGTSTLGGTSQAAPQVAGLVLLAQDIAETHLGRRLTPDEVEAVLRAGTASVTDSETGNDNVRNTGATFDRVDAVAMAEAVLALGPGGPGPDPTPTPTPTPELDAVPGGPETEAVLVPGQRADGVLETARDTDWYRVRVEAGATYEFGLAGAPSGVGTLSDPLLNLVDETGRILASDDDGGEGFESLLTYTAQASGELFLEARAYSDQTGSYRLTGERTGGDTVPAGPDTASVLVPGVAVDGEIDGLGDRDWHRLDAATGTAVEIRLAGAGGGGGTLADPVIRVVDAAGRVLAENDNAEGSRDARIVYAHAGDGPVYIEAAASADGGEGTYRLTAEAIATGGDVPGDISTGRMLETGQTVSEALGFAGDEDWFRVELAAGQRYDFALQGAPSGEGTLSDPLVRIHDAAGTELVFDDDGGEGLESLLTFRPGADGIYYVNAGSYNGQGTGTFALTMSEDGTGGGGGGGEIPDDTGTAATIADGQRAEGALETAGDADWYRVELEAGVTYTFTLEGQGSGAGTLADPLVRLHGPAGTEITFDDDGRGQLESELVYTASATGTHYVSAESYQRLYDGTYALAMAASGGGGGVGGGGADTVAGDPSTTAAVAPGGSVSGALNFAGDADWYRVPLVSGVDYTIDLLGAPSGAGTLSDPVLEVYDAAGRLVASDDDGGTGYESRLDLRPSQTGDFFIAARGYADAETGTYRIDVSGMGTGDTVPAGTGTGATIADGGTQAGRIDFDGDADWFAAEVEAGTLYRVGLAADGADPLSDPRVVLHDGDGLLVALDDNSGEGLDAELVFTAGETGTVHLSAEGSGPATGDYLLSFGAIPGGVDDGVPAGPGTPRAMDRGDLVVETIDAPGDADWVAVDLEAGLPYLFSMRGASGGGGTLADPVLSLVAADGTVLATDDDGGPGFDSLLFYTADRTGRAYLSAEGYEGATGSYTLGMAYAEEDGAPGFAEVGEPFAGLIDVAGDVDWIAVQLTGGEVYEVALAGAASGVGTLVDPLLGVRNPYGELIAQDDDSFGGLESYLTFVAPETGTYFLEAQAYGEEPGTSYGLLIA